MYKTYASFVCGSTLLSNLTGDVGDPTKSSISTTGLCVSSQQPKNKFIKEITDKYYLENR